MHKTDISVGVIFAITVKYEAILAILSLL